MTRDVNHAPSTGVSRFAALARTGDGVHRAEVVDDAAVTPDR
ncbi:hypothetical protein [Nocardia sp. NBC_00403]